MTNLLNADEAFAMAIQIESNASALYRRAAVTQRDAGTARLLEELAAMEDRHRQTFVDLRADAAAAGSDERTLDLNMEGVLFMSAIAAGYRIEGAPGVADAPAGTESPSALLATAIDLEKQSVLFYLGLLDTLTTETQRKAVERILDEEKSHVVTLAGKLIELGGGDDAVAISDHHRPGRQRP